MLLTPEQIERIRAIIRDASAAMALVVFDIRPDAATIKRLRDEGYISDEESLKIIEQGYNHGLAMAAHPPVEKMQYHELTKYLKEHAQPPTPREVAAAKFAKERAGNYCVGLGYRYADQMGRSVLQHSAELEQQKRTIIKTETERAIAEHRTQGELRTALRQATHEYARDWDRIANTEMQQAQQEGFFDATTSKHGAEAMMAKIPDPSACHQCRRLVLGPDGKPLIKPASWWEKNGATNVGRRARDWKAVVGAIHPHCRCQFVRVPEFMGFDENFDMIVLPDPDEVKKSTSDELIEGGLSSGKPDSAFNPAALAEGAKVEREHTKGARSKKKAKKIAKEIAKDHLAEDPAYYKKLAKIEKALPQAQTYDFQGLTVFVENPAGFVRHWENPHNGKAGDTRMLCDYGFITGTEGKDGDALDCFVGPDHSAPMAYIIHQRKAPDFKDYDEDKIIFGVASKAEAIRVYLAHFDDPRYLGPVTAMPVAELRDKIRRKENWGKMMKGHHPPEQLSLYARLDNLQKATLSGQAWDRDDVNRRTNSGGFLVHAGESKEKLRRRRYKELEDLTSLMEQIEEFVRAIDKRPRLIVDLKQIAGPLDLGEGVNEPNRDPYAVVRADRELLTDVAKQQNKQRVQSFVEAQNTGRQATTWGGIKAAREVY